MPFNGAGTYNTIGDPAIAGETIRADQFNNAINDLATALSNCVTRDGQSPAMANIPLGAHRLTGVADAVGAQDATTYSQLMAAVSTLNAAIAAVVDGQVWTGTHDFTGATVTVAAPNAASNPVTKLYADSLAFAAALPGQTGHAGEVVTTDGTTASWTTVESLFTKELGNKVINGAFQINQRTYVSGATLAAGAFGHDRWKAGANGGDYTFTQNAASTTITIASGKSLIQVVEDNNTSSTSYILSWTGTATARYAVNSATPAGSYAASPILITGQTVGLVMSIEFGPGTVGSVHLEPGSVVTPFPARQYGDELLLCSRYGTQIANASACGRAVSTTSISFVVAIPCQMRTAPTLSTSSVSGLAKYDGTGVTGTPSCGVSGMTANTLQLNVTGLTGATDSAVYWMNYTGFVSAEL